MKYTVVFYDTIERDEYRMDFNHEDQIVAHLDKNPHVYIKEYLEVEIDYKPYSAAQFFAYVIIGGVIGFWIGLGLFYLGEWLLS